LTPRTLARRTLLGVVTLCGTAARSALDAPDAVAARQTHPEPL
jgi:hypothetical protein